MTGRRPTPTALKLVKGTARANRLRADEPEPPRGLPEPPEHLSEEAKTEWARIGAILDAVGLVTEIDRGVLAAYCQAWGRWVKAEERLAEDGEVIDTDKGFPIQSPWLAISNKAWEHMTKAAVEFGMTPSSRTRVKAAAPKQKASPLEEFIGS